MKITNTFYTINGLYKLMEKALKRNDYDKVDAIEKVMDVLIWIEKQNKVIASYSKGYIKLTTTNKVSYIKYSEMLNKYEKEANEFWKNELL